MHPVLMSYRYPPSLQPPMCAVQGVGGELAKGETAAQRLGWYQEVYTIVEQQLQNKRYYICLHMLQLHTIGSGA